LAENHRPAGLDCDLPKMPLTQRIDACHDMVFPTLTGAAGDDDRIEIAAGVRQRTGDVGGRIR
jgi:hypothetical protein